MTMTTSLFNINTTPTVAVMGDTHGNGNATIAGLKFAKSHGVNTVFHVGDLGAWNTDWGRAYLRAVTRQLKLYGMTMYVTYGNHDDYSLLSDIGDEPVVWLSENVAVFNRPTFFTVNDTSLAVSFGGANSIDRARRKENIDWWPQESISYGDLYRFRAGLADLGQTPDVMLTHDAPSDSEFLMRQIEANREEFGPLPEEVERYARESSEMVRVAVREAEPKNLFHGHWHVRYTEQYGPTLMHGLDMDGHARNTVIVDSSWSILEEHYPWR